VPNKPSRGPSLSTVSRAEIAILVLVMAVVAGGAMAFAFLG
jgi:hypothetical protein